MGVLLHLKRKAGPFRGTIGANINLWDFLGVTRGMLRLRQEALGMCSGLYSSQTYSLSLAPKEA